MDYERYFLPLINEVKSIYDEEEKWQKKYNSYNIFQALGIERKEVKLHSNFIYNLLNPYASHEKSNILIKIFLEKVLNFPKEKLKDFDEDDYLFEREVYADEQSRIDFILYEIKEDFAHIIEMKIDACDQDKQLKRYDTFGKKNYTNHKVYYLTLDEKEASEQSAGNIRYDNITFKNHISTWLEDSLYQLKQLPTEKRNPQFEDIVNQYLITVNKISGNIENKNFEKKYLSCITKENIQAVEYFIKQAEELKINVLNRLNNEVYKRLQKKFPTLELISWEIVENEYVSIYIKKVKDLNNLSLIVAKEDSKLYFGIGVYKDEYKLLSQKYINVFKNDMKLKRDISDCIYYQYVYDFIEDECKILSDEIKRKELEDTIIKVFSEKIEILAKYKEGN